MPQWLTYIQQWDGHFPKKVWCFVSIVVKDCQLNHVMNVFNWPDVKDVRTGIQICAQRIMKKRKHSCLAKQASLQCKDLAPLWIEGLVDRVSLKPAVTELNDAQRVAFLCRRQKKWN